MASKANEKSKAKMTSRSKLRTARARARKVFGTAKAAQEWLESECPALGFVRPIDLLHNDDGLKNVTAILIRVEHGVIS